MPPVRKFAVAVAAFRIAYGLGLVAAPGRLTKPWLGPAGKTGPTQVGVRGLGMRDALLHVGLLQAALAGTPLRPWLAASIVGDLTDVASTASAKGEVPEFSPRA